MTDTAGISIDVNTADYDGGRTIELVCVDWEWLNKARVDEGYAEGASPAGGFGWTWEAGKEANGWAVAQLTITPGAGQATIQMLRSRGYEADHLW